MTDIERMMKIASRIKTKDFRTADITRGVRGPKRFSNPSVTVAIAIKRGLVRVLKRVDPFAKGRRLALTAKGRKFAAGL